LRDTGVTALLAVTVTVEKREDKSGSVNAR
jgi:hypothetical protein